MLFIVREPGVPVTYGSVVAAPFAKDVLEKCLKYANVVPTEPVDELVEVPDFSGMGMAEAAQKAQEYGFSSASFGSGNVAAQSPSAGTKAAKGISIDLYGNSGTAADETPVVPDLSGKTLLEAYKVAKERGFEIKVSGNESGVVQSQTPKADERAVAGEIITVTCG